MVWNFLSFPFVRYLSQTCKSERHVEGNRMCFFRWAVAEPLLLNIPCVWLIAIPDLTMLVHLFSIFLLACTFENMRDSRHIPHQTDRETDLLQCLIYRTILYIIIRLMMRCDVSLFCLHLLTQMERYVQQKRSESCYRLSKRML